MDLDQLTLGEVRQLAQAIGYGQARSHSLTVGSKVFIRTVTTYFTGRIESITDTDIVLRDAAWIPDTGRFAQAIKSGVFSEVEPYPDKCVVQRDAIVDWSPWAHDLPRGVK